MREAELFAIGLGISSPWKIINLELVDNEVHVYVDFEKGARFNDLAVHDTVDRTWRDLNFFKFPCYVHARVPRVKDPSGKVSMVEVPWARPGSTFTLAFESLLIRLMLKMPVKAAADEVGEHDTRLWRIVHAYVEKMRSQMDLSSLTRVGLDETAARRGHHYISVFVDLSDRRVVFACPGRGASTLLEFKTFLEERSCDPRQISQFSCDMSQAYLSGIEEHFPGAEVTLDKFHLVAMVQGAVDETRREEVKGFSELKKTRYLWLKNPGSLSAKASGMLTEFLETHKFSSTVRAYSLRLQFQEIFKQPKAFAGALFEAWTDVALRSEVPAMVKVARVFWQRRHKILRWFETKISNGVLEGLHSVLQATKNKARGYRNVNNLIAMSYLLHGKRNPATHSI